MPELLARDVHPAEVSTPDGGVLRGRAFATTHRLIVWTEPERGRVEQALNVQLLHEGFVPRNRGSLQGALECPTTEGTFWVNRGRGCGCGQTALRSLAPPVGWQGQVTP